MFLHNYQQLSTAGREPALHSTRWVIGILPPEFVLPPFITGALISTASFKKKKQKQKSLLPTRPGWWTDITDPPVGLWRHTPNLPADCFSTASGWHFPCKYVRGLPQVVVAALFTVGEGGAGRDGGGGGGGGEGGAYQLTARQTASFH